MTALLPAPTRSLGTPSSGRSYLTSSPGSGSGGSVDQAARSRGGSGSATRRHLAQALLTRGEGEDCAEECGAEDEPGDIIGHIPTVQEFQPLIRPPDNPAYRPWYL